MVTTHENRDRESLVTASIWWLLEHPGWLRVVMYGSVPIAAFTIATLSGSGIGYALRFAALQAAIIGGSALVVTGLRRLF